MSVPINKHEYLVPTSSFQEKQADFLDAVEQADSGTSFFGFNFNVSEARTVGIGNALITSLNSTYYDTVKTNLDAIYATVIDEYTTSTVKVDPNIYCPLINIVSTLQLIGWWVFASMLVIKGQLFNHFFGRSFDGRAFEVRNKSLAKSIKHKPILQNFELSFPLDKSLLHCYKERSSCIENDLEEEVSVHGTKSLNILCHFYYLGWNFGEQSCDNEESLFKVARNGLTTSNIK